MPRKPRFFLPGVTAHIVQRGHSRNAVFFDDDDYSVYLGWLGEAAERYGCAVHAYVLMENHIHLLATPQDKQSISRMMQYIGRYYVPYINYTYGTSGTIWEGRYKASLIDVKQYLISCMRYIELNPVRAGLTRSPAFYRWSSYRANAQGKPNELITPHPLYLKLGRSKKKRADSYKQNFKIPIDPAELIDIRQAWQTGTPLGNELFKQNIETTLNCKVGQARRGRPRKALPH
jgi:putative transposase